MLSATKRIIGSAAADRVFFNAALKAASSVPSRNYLPGRNWQYLSGISLRDGIADVPASAPSIYSSRREKCGVIVMNRSKVGCCIWMTDGVVQQFVKQGILYHISEERSECSSFWLHSDRFSLKATSTWAPPSS